MEQARSPTAGEEASLQVLLQLQKAAEQKAAQRQKQGQQLQNIVAAALDSFCQAEREANEKIAQIRNDTLQKLDAFRSSEIHGAVVESFETLFSAWRSQPFLQHFAHVHKEVNQTFEQFERRERACAQETRRRVQELTFSLDELSDAVRTSERLARQRLRDYLAMRSDAFPIPRSCSAGVEASQAAWEQRESLRELLRLPAASETEEATLLDSSVSEKGAGRHVPDSDNNKDNTHHSNYNKNNNLGHRYSVTHASTHTHTTDQDTDGERRGIENASHELQHMFPHDVAGAIRSVPRLSLDEGIDDDVFLPCLQGSTNTHSDEHTPDDPDDNDDDEDALGSSEKSLALEEEVAARERVTLRVSDRHVARLLTLHRRRVAAYRALQLHSRCVRTSNDVFRQHWVTTLPAALSALKRLESARVVMLSRQLRRVATALTPDLPEASEQEQDELDVESQDLLLRTPSNQNSLEQQRERQRLRERRANMTPRMLFEEVAQQAKERNSTESVAPVVVPETTSDTGTSVCDAPQMRQLLQKLPELRRLANRHSAVTEPLHERPAKPFFVAEDVALPHLSQLVFDARCARRWLAEERRRRFVAERRRLDRQKQSMRRRERRRIARFLQQQPTLSEHAAPQRPHLLHLQDQLQLPSSTSSSPHSSHERTLSGTSQQGEATIVAVAETRVDTKIPLPEHTSDPIVLDLRARALRYINEIRLHDYVGDVELYLTSDCSMGRYFRRWLATHCDEAALYDTFAALHRFVRISGNLSPEIKLKKAAALFHTQFGFFAPTCADLDHTTGSSSTTTADVTGSGNNDNNGSDVQQQQHTPVTDDVGADTSDTSTAATDFTEPSKLHPLVPVTQTSLALMQASLTLDTLDVFVREITQVRDRLMQLLVQQRIPAFRDSPEFVKFLHKKVQLYREAKLKRRLETNLNSFGL
ncbi:MAG: hypothetical protein MHM6MM_006516 [Cercozoa sp. M6MM]